LLSYLDIDWLIFNCYLNKVLFIGYQRKT